MLQPSLVQVYDVYTPKQPQTNNTDNHIQSEYALMHAVISLFFIAITSKMSVVVILKEPCNLINILTYSNLNLHISIFDLAAGKVKYIRARLVK